MANDHYISRFLTKPWEIPGSQKRLAVCQKERRITRVSSERLFAQEGLHSKETESRLGALIESPFGSFRAKLLASPTVEEGAEVLRIDDWRVYRALFLMPFLQTPRTMMAREGIRSPEFDGILALDDGALDALFAKEYRESKLMVLTAAPGFPLYFPAGGLFAVPVETTNGFPGFAMAMPLTPFHCLAVAPPTARPVALHGPKSLSVLSVGVYRHDDRFVIPPAILDAYPDDAELVPFLVGLRECARESMEAFNRVLELSTELFRKAGLEPPQAGPFAGVVKSRATAGDGEP